jgi:hypothetical protein
MALELKYFVLKPKAKGKNDLFASASQEAMFKYADVIEDIDKGLAIELRMWARKEVARQYRLAL